MSFKTFIWPQNPETLRIEHSSEPTYGKTSAGKYVMSGMTGDRCTISGSGEFTGPVACDNVIALEALIAETTSGLLYLPDGTARQAYLTAFHYTQDPREQYVAYEFAFRTTDSSGLIPKL